MAQVDLQEAKAKLAKLVEQAQLGEDIVIARNGKPVARLVRVTSTSALATVRGAWRDQVRIADDFDEMPADLADALGARPT